MTGGLQNPPSPEISGSRFASGHCRGTSVHSSLVAFRLFVPRAISLLDHSVELFALGNGRLTELVEPRRSEWFGPPVRESDNCQAPDQHHLERTHRALTVSLQNRAIVGAEIFQTYRKRLLLPGIAMEIRRDYPGLSILDVLVRVHAGRQIIRDGEDFRALQASRSGAWQQMPKEYENRRASAGGRRDRVSRLLVTLGGFLFAGFCLLSLLSVVSGGPGAWLIVGMGLGFVAALLCWRRLSGGEGAGLSSGCDARFS